MSKKIKNRLIAVTAVFVVVVVLVTAISNGLPERGQARPMFSGLDTLIADHSDEENPYTIVEVVPDKRLAKLGYLVDGNEPYYYDEETGSLNSWETGLAKQNSSEARKSYMNSMKSNLSALIGSDNALSYEDYQESVVAADGYQKLSLAQKEILPKGTKGIGIVEQAGGEYVYDSSYAIAEADETGYHGNLDQNILYYDVSADNKYYDLGFSAVDADTDISNGAYTLSSATVINSEDAWAGAKNIYYLDDTDGKTYIRLPQEEREDTAFEKGRYVELVFSYTTDTSDTEKVYYLPDLRSLRFSGDASGEYGAVLDENEPYIENQDNGHFTRTGENAYIYVGEGKGAYTLKLGVSYELEGDVQLDHIYYTGGFSNNNLLLKQVFNQNSLGENADGNIKLQVKTVTPAELTANMINEADMIYVSDSSAYNGDAYSEYNSQNDLTTEAAYALYTFAETNQFPVMLDHNVLSRTEAGNLYKVAAILEAEDLTGYIGADYDTYMDYDASEFVLVSDSDHHFVHGNVYVVPGDGKTTFLDHLSLMLCDGTDMSEDDFAAAARKAGFGEIADMIISENFIRKTENSATHAGYEMFDQKISEATAVEYIISYVNKREEYSIDTLKVLDIEPYPYAVTRDWVGKIQDNAFKDEMESRIKTLLGAPDDMEIEITHKSMAEFEGTVEDLCNYDVIYMGLEIDPATSNPTLTTVTEMDRNGAEVQVTRSDFNDDAMDGLVYTNIGDLVSASGGEGILDTDYNVTSLGAYSMEQYNGVSQSSANKARKAGNDITDEKLHALQTVANAGTPIILADNFLTTYGDSTQKVVYDYGHDASWNADKSKNGYIDNCSKVYELIDSIKDYPNVMLEGELVSENGSVVYSSQQNLLIRYATLGKPVLTMKTSDKVEGENYVLTNGAFVEIDFSIANYGSANANASFDCVLYVDYNADGRYSDVTERIEASDYTVSLNGKEQEVKLKTFTDSKGNSFESYCYELTPSSDKIMYHLEYNVSDLVGLLPVKLKITQSTNANRYDSDIAYFYHPVQNDQKQEIRVLQILPETIQRGTQSLFDMDLTPSEENEFYQKYGEKCNIEKYKYSADGKYRDPSYYMDIDLSGASEEDYKAGWNELFGKFADSTFSKYIDYGLKPGETSMLNDFELNIDSVWGGDFAAAYAQDPDCLDDYDMLVLGFADCYDMLSYYPDESDYVTYTKKNRERAEAAYEGIHAFVKSGKSVLFTHDTTSGQGAPNTKSPDNMSGVWGAYTNEYIVPDVGMERYGVYSDLVARAGISGLTLNGTKSYAVSSYASLKKLKEQGALTNSSYTSGELYSMIVDYAEKNDLDVGYVPNSEKTSLVAEIQGYSDAFLNLAQFNYVKTSEMINEGQILVYPYNLLTDLNEEYDRYNSETNMMEYKQKGTLPIAETHCQYYQLDMNADMDNDGESDTTVWFTLTGNDRYDKTYREARNNYYIYTRGNITYSGVGHTNISPLDDSDAYLPELKLYINTMITSYKGGTHKPTVTIKQGDSSKSADLSTVYVGTDYHIYGEKDVQAKGDTGAEGEIDYNYYDNPDDALLDKPGETETLYFYVSDTNRVTNGKKTISVDYYQLCDSKSEAEKMAASGESVVNIGTDEKPQYAVKKNWKTYESNATDEVSNAANLKSGRMYAVKMPYSVLGDDDESTQIRISVTTKIEYEISKNNSGNTIAVTKTSRLEGYDDVTVQRTGLFDLE